MVVGGVVACARERALSQGLQDEWLPKKGGGLRCRGPPRSPLLKCSAPLCFACLPAAAPDGNSFSANPAMPSVDFKGAVEDAFGECTPPRPRQAPAAALQGSRSRAQQACARPAWRSPSPPPPRGQPAPPPAPDLLLTVAVRCSAAAGKPECGAWRPHDMEFSTRRGLMKYNMQANYDV